MIICPEFRVTFLAVPRTASRSIYQWLTENSSAENEPKVFGGYHGRELPSEFVRWFSFAVVRHPYTRALSFWQHATRVREEPSELFNRCGGEQSFESFVAWLAKKRPEDPIEWGNQTSILHGIKLNHIVYYEKLEREFSRLPFVPKKSKLPWIGKTTSKRDWKTYYENPKVVQAVQGWASKDFETFNYTLDYHLTDRPFIQ